jgi:hypothetical protein
VTFPHTGPVRRPAADYRFVFITDCLSGESTVAHANVAPVRAFRRSLGCPGAHAASTHADEDAEGAHVYSYPAERRT